MKIGSADVALVTGAGGGIGSAICKALLDRGAKVVFADIGLARAESVRQQLGVGDDRAVAIALDVTDGEAWGRAVETAEAALGPMSILVNNAGVGHRCPLAEDDPQRWRWVLEVDAFGPFLGCRSVLPGMLARRRGHIVNIASIAGFSGVLGMSAYCAGKHAVVGMTESMRIELAETGIGLTLVAPGSVATHFFANSASAISARAREPELGPDPLADGITPDRVGRRIAEAIIGNEPLVLTHPEWKTALATAYADRFASVGVGA